MAEPARKGIVVVVVNENGQFLADGSVTATNADTGATLNLTSNQEGAYKGDLVAGQYSVTATQRGYQPKKIEFEVTDASPDPLEVKLSMEVEVPTKTKLMKVLVSNPKGERMGDVDVAAVNTTTRVSIQFSDKGEGLYQAYLKVEKYTIVVKKIGYREKSINIDISEVSTDTIEVNLEEEGKTMAEAPEIGVEELLAELAKDEHSIEPKILPAEAWQGIGLFSAVNFILAGKADFNGGGAKKTDVLGIMKLFYGLQDKSLVNKIVTQDSQSLWKTMQDNALPELAQTLDRMQGDLDFIYREAKRQFNLGTNNTVLGNIQFPSIFKKYVEQGSDPLLSIDLKKAQASDFFDKEKLEKAYDLLRDLKETIIEVVRSLSKYGTSATFRVNKDWGKFLKQALVVLGEVANRRVSDDQDDKNTWSVVATLTEQNREAIIPYVTLGDYGASLLKYAVQIYLDPNNKPDDFSPEACVALFQGGNDPNIYWTTKIRTAARFVKRYPLTTWG